MITFLSSQYELFLFRPRSRAMLSLRRWIRIWPKWKVNLLKSNIVIRVNVTGKFGQNVCLDHFSDLYVCENRHNIHLVDCISRTRCYWPFWLYHDILLIDHCHDLFDISVLHKLCSWFNCIVFLYSFLRFWNHHKTMFGE